MRRRRRIDRHRYDERDRIEHVVARRSLHGPRRHRSVGARDPELGARHVRAELDGDVEALGWIDDGRFAGALVRARVAKHIGRNRLQRELQEAGVDRDVAASALRQNVDDDAERESLRQAVEKRSRLLVRRHGEDWLASAEGRNKLTAWLLKQGYDAGLVRAVLDARRFE